MSIERATLDDATAINDIYNWSVINSTATFDCDVRPIEERIAWIHAHQSDRLPAFVYKIDGVVVAWGSLNAFSERVGYNSTTELSIYVDPAHHGQGIGSIFLKFLHDEAVRLNYHCILSKIAVESVASLRIHEKLGFEQVGLLKEVGMKFGRYLDVAILQKLINK